MGFVSLFVFVSMCEYMYTSIYTKTKATNQPQCQRLTWRWLLAYWTSGMKRTGSVFMSLMGLNMVKSCGGFPCSAQCRAMGGGRGRYIICVQS